MSDQANDVFGPMQIRPLFPSPLVITTINDAEPTRAALEAAILARELAQPSVAKSNQGGWQSTDDLVAWAGDDAADLLDAAGLLASRLTFLMQGEEANRADIAWRVSAWANINRAGNHNDVHTHAGAQWSAVYYVRVDDIDAGPPLAGALELVDPRGVTPIMYAPSLRMAINGCVTAGASEYHKPEAGQLVMFPSWLPHAVRPYMGNGVRISIAMNFSV